MQTKNFKVGTVDFKCYKYDYKSVNDFVKEFDIKNYELSCYTKPNGKLTSRFTFDFGKFGTIELTSCTWLVISSDDVVYILKDSEVDNLDIFTETIAWIDNEVAHNTKDYKKDDDTDDDVEIDVDDFKPSDKPVKFKIDMDDTLEKLFGKLFDCSTTSKKSKKDKKCDNAVPVKPNDSIRDAVNTLIGDKPKYDTDGLFNYKTTTTTNSIDKDELATELAKENVKIRRENKDLKNDIQDLKDQIDTFKVLKKELDFLRTYIKTNKI